MPRLASTATAQYYPTPIEVVDLIAEYLWTVPGHKPLVRILDPCCGPGHAVAHLANRISQNAAVQTYGIELNNERANEAEDQLNAALQADIFSTTISNNAFSVLFLNPPYDYEEDGKRTEHAFLTRTTPMLRTNGLLIYIVSQHNLAPSVRYLANNYEDVECYAFPDPHFERFKQLVLFGTKKQKSEPEPEAAREIHKHTLQLPEPLSDNPSQVYKLAPANDTPIMFAARNISPAKALHETDKHGLWGRPQALHTFWRQAENHRPPLMPLRKGHISTLFASGFLDNLILDNDEQRIIVKGHTEKITEIVRDDETETVYRDKTKTTISAIDLDTGEITHSRM